MTHGDTLGEFRQQLTLGEQVMSQTRVTYVRLRDLLSTDKYRGPEDKRPESAALDNALDSFVAANFDPLNTGEQVPFNTDVLSAIDKYKETMVSNKLIFAIFQELKRRQKAEITGLLEGRTVTVRNLGDGIYATDGRGTSWRAKQEEVRGMFLNYNPQLAELELAREGGTYSIHLWEESMDFETRTVGVLLPAVELSVE